MTKDCSWNYHENYKRKTLAEHGENSMNNPLSYCGLVAVKIRASDIYLPVSTCGLSKGLPMLVMYEGGLEDCRLRTTGSCTKGSLWLG